MNGPNKTVAAFNARKVWAEGMMTFRTKDEAEVFSSDKEREGFRVRNTTMKTGPRKATVVKHNVHWFAK